MDNIFRSEEHEFITKPVTFRTFYIEALEARNAVAKSARRPPFLSIRQQRSINEAFLDRFIRLADVDMREAVHVRDLLDMDRLVSPLVQFQRGMDDEPMSTLPISGLRSLHMLQKEINKRRNPQYKSLALRQFAYDRMEMSLLTMRQRLDERITCNGEVCCGETSVEELCKALYDDPNVKKEVEDNNNDENKVKNATSRVDGPTTPEAGKETLVELETVVKQEVKDDEEDQPAVDNQNMIYDIYQDVMTNVLTVEEQVKLDADAVAKTKALELAMQYNSCSDVAGFGDALIASVSIFLGYTRQLTYQEMRLGRLLKVTDRLMVGGECTLKDIKTSFSCPQDYTFDVDLSEQKPELIDMSANKYPSSFFFIHDTFYVDMLPANAQDITSEIIAWARKRSDIGPFHIRDMNSAKIIDLTCRLGQPYLYVHQGSCEHLIAFTDLRLRDENNATDCNPPVKLVERCFRRFVCSGCKNMTAEWMVLDHPEAIVPNLFLCHSCYTSFSFDGEGNKKANFKAVPYCDRKSLEDSGSCFLSKLSQEVAERERIGVESDGPAGNGYAGYPPRRGPGSRGGKMRGSSRGRGGGRGRGSRGKRGRTAE